MSLSFLVIWNKQKGFAERTSQLLSGKMFKLFVIQTKRPFPKSIKRG